MKPTPPRSISQVFPVETSQAQGRGRLARDAAFEPRWRIRPRATKTSLYGQLTQVGRSVLPERPLEFVAITLVFVCVFSDISGALAALGLLIFGVLLYARGLDGARRLLMWSPLLAYPLLQLATTLWSADPSITSRYAGQLLITALIGLYAGVFRSPADCLRILFVSASFVIIVSIISGKMGGSADGEVLVGITGSKDALAITAQSAAQAGLALALMRGGSIWRIAGLAILPIGAYLALHSNAATGVINLAVGLSLAIALRTVSLLGGKARLIAAFMVLVVAVAVLMLHQELMRMAQDFSINVLHKDPTLTGRTVLWDHARAMIQQRPLLGWGYREAWLGSSVDTTGLLRWAGLLDGRGFFFHEQWLDSAVDSGYLGMALIIAFYALLGLLLAIGYLRGVNTPAYEFVIVVFAITILNSFAATFILPFSTGSAEMSLFGVIAFRAALRRTRSA